MNLFQHKIISSVLVVTFLAILGGACCGSLAFASMTSHDATIHYKMLDGNTTTIDSAVSHENNAKQCHINTSDRIIDATSTKNIFKLSMHGIDTTDIAFKRALFVGDGVHIASISPPRNDLLFSVIKKE